MHSFNTFLKETDETEEVRDCLSNGKRHPERVKAEQLEVQV